MTVDIYKRTLEFVLGENSFSLLCSHPNSVARIRTNGNSNSSSFPLRILERIGFACPGAVPPAMRPN
jgi:hypothetical protein